MTITVYGNTNGTALSATYSQPSGGGISPGNVSPGNGNGTPGSGNGPGGIGNGDGGFSTPSNNLFGIPVITFPNSGDNTGIEESDTVTSSVFDDGGTGATHTASRWMIMLLGEDGDTPNSNSPIYIYDSGVDTGNLTTLPLTVVELQHDTQYAVRVRYKANDGTWSRWSFDQSFTSYSCPVPADLSLHIDFSDTTGYEETAGAITDINNLGSGAAPLVWAQSGTAAELADIGLLSDVATFVGGDAYNSGPVLGAITTGTIFFVAELEASVSVDSFLGISNTTNPFAFAPGGNEWIGVFAGPGNTGYGSISYSGSGDFLEGAANDIPAGAFILEITMQPSGDGDSYMYINGTQVASGTLDLAYSTGANISAVNDSTSGQAVGSIAEMRIYTALLTAGQREAIRTQLAAKWGVTFVNTTGPSV